MLTSNLLTGSPSEGTGATILWYLPGVSAFYFSYLEQSVTFWCQYWSRDQSRDHFGLEIGLETSLVTLGSVTFWSQNGLETGSRPLWSQKWSRDLVSSLSDLEEYIY